MSENLTSTAAARAVQATLHGSDAIAFPKAGGAFSPLLTTYDWNEEWKALQRSRKAADDASYWDKRSATFGTKDAPNPYVDRFLELAGIRPGETVFDMGCGTGLLGLLLLQRQSELTVTGIDIQPAAVALAERAAAENRLTDRLTFRCIDLRQVRQHFSTGSFDLVVCNPPYYPPASGKVSGDSARRTARSETEVSLADICAAASYLLRWGGKFCLVHKPERLTDTACALREAGMEPKRLRFVQNRPDTAPSLFLIEGCRGGKPGVDIQPPLLLQTDTGAPTGELNVIYFRDQEV